MRKQMLLGVWLVLSSIFAFSQQPSDEAKGGNTAEHHRSPLKVALFPYIPAASQGGYAALEKRIKAEFESRYPTIDLTLRPLNPNDDFYKMDFLKSLLNGDPRTDPNAYDIVEVDGVLLGDIVEGGLVRPWRSDVPTEDFLPAAQQAMRYHGQLYGIPHWLCGFFIFSRSPSVAAAKSTANLVAALNAISAPAKKITGNFVSSWDTPALYLGAWVDKHGQTGLETALQRELDPEVLSDFKRISEDCRTGNKNPCTDKTYKDNDQAALEFAKGVSAATFGYSERLNFILKNSGDKVFVTPLQLSDVANPVLFVDVLALNPHCTDACEQSARSFAMYLDSEQTYEWILLSDDSVSEKIPRYLLPASEAAYRSKRIAADPYYKVFRSWSEKGLALPDKGMLSEGRCVRSKILQYLGEPQQEAECVPPAVDSSAENVLEAKIRKGWEDYKNRNKEAFASILANDFGEVTTDAEGIIGKDAELSGMGHFNLMHYELTDFKLRPVGADGAVMTYTARYSASYDDAPLQMKAIYGEVWLKQDHDWKLLWVQETRIK